MNCWFWSTPQRTAWFQKGTGSFRGGKNLFQKFENHHGYIVMKIRCTTSFKIPTDYALATQQQLCTQNMQLINSSSEFTKVYKLIREIS